VCTISFQGRNRTQRASPGIHTADVCDEEVFYISRFSAQLSVEVEAAGSQATLIYDNLVKGHVYISEEEMKE